MSLYESISWQAPGCIQAIVTNRSGGVSENPYSALNLAYHVDDNPVHVAANREALREAVGLPSEPHWMSQVHGKTTLNVSTPGGAGGNVPIADAAYTRSDDCVLAVMVADCLPILLCTETGDEIAVVHAGWRGMAEGVIESCLSCFRIVPAFAFLGPGISQSHYEVGNDVMERFSGTEHRHFDPCGPDKWRFSLQGLAADKLRSAGVQNVSASEDCTYRDSEKFFSFRRDGATGRFALLMWRKG
jgi:YfiH family protein